MSHTDDLQVEEIVLTANETRVYLESVLAAPTGDVSG